MHNYFLGRSKNYFYNRINNRWQRVNEKFDLPAQTLIYAEAVQECRGEAKGMRKCPSLHVIDAMYVAGEDWRNHDLKTRNEMLKIFVKAMAKPSLPGRFCIKILIIELDFFYEHQMYVCRDAVQCM